MKRFAVHRMFFAAIYCAVPVAAVQVGNYVSHTASGNVVTITCVGAHKVRITACSPSAIQVIFDPAGAFNLRGDLLTADFVGKTFPPVNPSVSDEGTYVKIKRQS